MSEARCQDNLKEDVSCGSSARVCFELKPWRQSLGRGSSKGDTCKGLFTTDRLTDTPRAQTGFGFPTVFYNKVAATNSTGE